RRKELMGQRRRVHAQVCQRVDSVSRSEICRRLLAGDGGALRQRLTGTHQIEIYGFARNVWKLTNQETAREPTSESAFTDLGLPLDRALEQPDAHAVILMSDGRHNRGELPASRAATLGERKTPIYPIALGSRQAGPDVAIIGLETPNAVFKNADGSDQINTTVKATLRVRGLPAQEIVVELQGMGRTLEQKRIVHNGTDQDYPLAFATTLNEEGTQKLTVTARPARDTGHAANRSRSALVKVVEDQAEVLL